ncbi:uncharacterized protein C20orf204 homolog isoform X2 [Apus apus]|uniref:uncharacterized protein C20orf204 homolog isoform X2 n=1 Tax=Apus apus TaxID=8895 RepID=UPI0021F909FA|nr:uncharacterized protein C20orf204 homolog isoform X2 [Apus apus]
MLLAGEVLGTLVEAESLGTDPTQLQRSLAPPCAKYLSPERAQCVPWAVLPELEQLLKRFAARGCGSAGRWLLQERTELSPLLHMPCLQGQILPRALSCALLLLLLVAVLSRGKRCSIAKILRQYRAVIFHEIQNLKNLSGSMDRSRRARLACRSDKDQKILLSIYNITMSLQEVAAGTLHGPEELVVWKVARNTDFVLRENCRKISKSRPRVPTRPRRGAPARRRKQLREIGRKAERLATCWEKLYALHAPRPAPRDS